jgi:hypothetical protein
MSARLARVVTEVFAPAVPAAAMPLVIGGLRWGALAAAAGPGITRLALYEPPFMDTGRRDRRDPSIIRRRKTRI